MVIIGLFVFAISWCVSLYESNKRVIVSPKEEVKQEEQDESWWREIFDC